MLKPAPCGKWVRESSPETRVVRRAQTVVEAAGIKLFWVKSCLRPDNGRINAE